MAITYLKNCRMVDGTAAPAIENAIVVYDSATELITYAGPAEGAPDISVADEVLDCCGYTVLPGLFNVHAHMNLIMPFLPYRVDQHPAAYCSLMVYRRAIEALQCGVTSIRCMADRHYADIAVRNAINKKMLWGPNMVTCGNMMIAHNGHSNHNPHSVECTGYDEFLKQSRLMLKAGADFLKICLTGGMSGSSEGFRDKQMTDNEVRAVVEAAHMAGKKVAVHIGGDKPIQDAIRLGIDSIEHAYIMSDETAQMLKEADRWLVPTLSVTRTFDYLTSHGAPDYQVNKLREAADLHEESIKRAIKRDVKIAVGTDLLPSDPVYGTNATVYEIEMLVKAGMTPLKAINAATGNSAELCGLSGKTGTLVAGKLADIIIVEGKPDEDIHAMRNLKFVAKSGSLVWSKLSGYERQVLQAVPPTTECGGGTYRKW